MVDDWLTIVLALGLAVRITRLITLDVITQPIRDRLSGFLGALVECPWCTGVWVAVPVGLSWWAWSGQTWWQVSALIGTIAWASGAGAAVGMPRQVEVATVAPVAIVNADEPVVDTFEHTLNVSTELSDDELDRIGERVRTRMRLGDSGAAAADDGADGAY